MGRLSSQFDQIVVRDTEHTGKENLDADEPAGAVWSTHTPANRQVGF